MDIKDFQINKFFVQIGADNWVLQVFVVVLCTVVLDFAVRLVLRRIYKQLSKTKNMWDDALLQACRSPLLLLIWTLGITFAADVVLSKTGTTLFEIAEPVRNVCVITAIAWFLIRFIREAEKNLILRAEEETDRDAGLDRSTSEAIGKLLRLSVIITACIVGLQTLGFSISGVLAFGGVGGIAVGFAARDLLANFFGGLMIYLDRPFMIGDWVRSPDRNIEGTVEYIGWRQTRIRTFDKRPLYVPNSIFSNIVVENPSRMQNRRIYETLGIRYDDIAVMKPVITDVEAMLREHKDIDETLTMIVNFINFAPSSLDFMVYTFTHTTNWVEFHHIKQDVMLKIAAIIDKHGAEIAFPTSTLHLNGVLNTASDVTEKLPLDNVEVQQ